MRLIIVLCVFIAVTNAKLFKLWKKKDALKGKLTDSIKKDSVQSDSSAYSSLVLSAEENIPSNAVPVLIVPLSSSPLLQYELLNPTSLSTVNTGSISLTSPYLNTFKTAYFANQQPSYLSAYQYYIPQAQISPVELTRILENPSSETTSSSSASVTVNTPEHNPLIDVRAGFNTINSQPVVEPSRNFQFIPAKISSNSENGLVFQQNPIVPIYPPTIQDNSPIVSTNSYTGDYESSYTLRDGTFVTEKGEFVNGKDGNKILVKTGTYQRRGDNGEIVTVKWIADDNGFRVIE